MTALDHALARGRYTLDQRVAAGGMGEVWRGTDTSLGRTVAIKVLRPHVADDEPFRIRFATEAQNAASLHDPHIATVFDFGDDVDPAKGRHSTYLVMEFIDGVPLSELIGEPMQPEQAAGLVAQAARGLAAAHAAGLVHRDVKPANFIVTPEGMVKVTDFGIARARGAASITDTGTIMGTPHYVAPEVAEGREATPRSDIYSLGVVLYEALTGFKPFAGNTPIAVALAHLREEPRPLPSSVPARLRAIVGSMLDRDPARRPPDASSVADALAAFAAGVVPGASGAVAAAAATLTTTQVLPVVATPVTGTSGGQPPPAGRRRRTWLVLGGVAALVLLIVAVAYAATQGDQNEPTAQTSATQPSGSPSPSTPSASAPAAVTIAASSYVGRPFEDVEQDLRGLGLEVKKQDVEGGERDIVADLAPTGTLREGSLVTVAVFRGDEGHGGENGPGDSQGHGPGPEKPKHEED